MSFDLAGFRDELRKFAVVKTNELKRLLLDDQNKKSFTKNGLSLNGRGLVNTAIAVANSRDNLDRYKTFQHRQTTLAGFSFAFDFSGSMQWSLDPKHKIPVKGALNRYESFVYAMESLLNILTPLGIKSYIGGVMFERCHTERNQSHFETATDNIQTLLKVIKKDTERFDITKAFTGLQPNGSTYLVSYALGAIEMAKRIKGVDKRIAIFMTDGDDNSSIPYLKSIQEQAKSEGVELICCILEIGVSPSTITELQKQGVNIMLIKTPTDFISELTEALKKIY